MSCNWWYWDTPILMLKINLDGRVERRPHKNSLVKDIKVFAYFQSKAWNNMIIIKMWINEVWKRNSHFEFEEGHNACDGWCINAQN